MSNEYTFPFSTCEKKTDDGVFAQPLFRNRKYNYVFYHIVFFAEDWECAHVYFYTIFTIIWSISHIFAYYSHFWKNSDKYNTRTCLLYKFCIFIIFL